MMFRGKTESGEWVEGYYFQCWDDCFILLGTTNGLPNMTKIIPTTLAMITGRKDKNDKKIFGSIPLENGEMSKGGDIVKAMMDYGPGGFVERAVAINWHNEYGYQWNYFDLSTVEVIGNQTDNPELREQQ